MERELWPRLHRELRAVASATRHKGVRHHPWVIAAVLLWAAVHDRPVNWACDPLNWATTRLRPAVLPSAATASRRARATAFAVSLNCLSARLTGAGRASWELVTDGEPLPVGRCSEDPDAGGGRLGRGSKLPVVLGAGAWPEAWEVTGPRGYEGAVARRRLPQLRGWGILLADGNDEASEWSDAAWRAGYQLLARPEPEDNRAGHRYQSPHRRRALEWFAAGIGWQLYRRRTAIERAFGNAGSFAGGLGPLPDWVRRLGRVQRWVWCKLAINAHRILRNRERLG